MAIFNNNAPQQTFNVPKNYSDSPWLGILGYNQNGTRNAWGDVASYLPGIGLGTNIAANTITNGTDSHANTSSYTGDDIKKLLAEASVAATVLSGGTAAPVLGATGAIGDTVGTGIANATATAGDTASGIGEGAAGGVSDAIGDLGDTAASSGSGITNWVKQQAQNVIKQQSNDAIKNLTKINQNQGNGNIKGSYSLSNYNR